MSSEVQTLVNRNIFMTTGIITVKRMDPDYPKILVSIFLTIE
ncbi:MAG: hypothetical protein V3T59_09240 [Desulfobacterales bacterium]